MEYKGSDPVAGNRLRARRSQFRLISITQNCALFSREYKLPDWGFKQQEVTCMKDAKLPKTVWRIENTESELCKSIFFIQMTMSMSNSNI